jgi:hypothetical protein
VRVPSLLLLCALASVPEAAAQNCANTSTGRVPLNDLGAGTYQGFQGGLYPGGANTRPLAHEVGGLAQAALVVPRDAAGNVDPLNGRIGFISIGMSNCVIHFNAFMPLANADALKDPQVRLVNCAQGGQPAENIDDPSAPYWTYVMQALQNANLSAAQVQVVWFLEANSHPTAAFPQHAQDLQAQFATIAQIVEDKFPNCRLFYPASRIYAGYATTALNPEPWAYEQAFSVKWLIEDQINGNPALNYDPAVGPVEAPWIGWGPYMWADGLIPRSDGLTWVCSDFNTDGTHPSAQGANKNAGYLLAFCHDDTTAESWYRASPAPVAYGVGKTTSIGSVPSVGSTGSPKISQNNFQVTLSGGVPNKPVLAFYGASPQLQPFLGGTLFVKPPLTRLPAQVLDATGSTAYSIPLFPALLDTTRDYQFWFRDPAHPDGTGVGLSNGLQVRFFN